MENKEKSNEYEPGELHKRREKMEGSERYIIYYTFVNSEADEQSEEPDNV